MKKRTKGFTLVEIMIVVAIIGLLIAIALPNFLKARKKSIFRAAQGSMRQVEGACEQARLDGLAITNWNETTIEAVVVDEYVKVWPTCPGGGTWNFDRQDWMAADIGSATIYVTNVFRDVEDDM
jgi:prepilin-type N-terminal cleavage/methylation domain-containing protein